MTDELTIGQVQWHSSEEDGGPDVGILLRLDDKHLLWWGELLAGEGDGFGAIIYGPGNERKVFEAAYDELRQVFEDYVAPALRGVDFYAGRYAERCGQLLEANTTIAELASAVETAFDFLGGIDGAAETRDELLAAILAAQGTEARSAETEGLGPQDDGPVAEGDAPDTSPDTFPAATLATDPGETASTPAFVPVASESSKGSEPR